VPPADHIFVDDDFVRYGIPMGEPLARPRFLQVELTDRCNLTCPACVRAIHRSAGTALSQEDLERMLDDAPDLEHVSFVGAGEALLRPDFADFVRLCTDRDIRTSCNTNGKYVRRRLHDAVAAGLGRLAISIDAVDPELVREIRGGLTLEALIRGIEAAVDETAGTETVLSAAVTLSLRNVDSFDEIVDFTAAHGIREMTVESLHHWGDDKTLNALSLFAGDADATIAHLDRGLEAATRRGVRVTIFDYRRRLRATASGDALCPWAWDACFVTASGDVTPCCVNIESTPAATMGNALTDGLLGVWMSDRFERLRESLRSGPPEPMCDGCVYRAEFGKLR
jgi:MoaA/NifB/PqqE/SkfB family radical SAM enzyme